MEFLFQNMIRALEVFWVFVSKFTVCIFGAIIRFIFRFQIDGYCTRNEIRPPRLNGFKEKQRVEHDENEKRARENVLVATSSMCGFLYRTDISGFVEEPKTESFTLHEFFMGSGDPTEPAQIHLPEPDLGTDDGFQEKIRDPIDSFVSGKSGETRERDTNGVFERKTEYSVEEDAGGSVEDKAEHSVESFIEEQKMEANINLEETEEDSIEICIIEKKLEKREPRIEAADGTEEERLEKQERDEKEESDALEVKTGDSVQTSSIEMNSDDQDTFCLYESNLNVETESSRMIDSTFEFAGSEKVENKEEIHLYRSLSEIKAELGNSFVGQEHSSNESIVCSEKLGESISYSDEEDDDTEYEELKMQLRMTRTGGLPTISEESEFSKMVEELHPLKINEKLDRKNHIVEIQKVYKRYSDKMRKLDILNSQTKYAISLLQLSDLVQPNATRISSAAPIKSVLQKNIWPFKQRKPEIDRAAKLIRDLEIVYVGQMCLSWEILRWQHGKVQQLLQYDPQGSFRYNHVAGEFQLFQVLVQRCLENEPFQGRPRVENYVKNRCLLPNFLQVPVIKDDGTENGKRGLLELDDHATSNALLIEIIEESMQVFWEFLRADKDETNLSLKAPPQQRQVAPQDPLDLGILMNVRTNLQKKERRLKEIMRSTNCIVKKLQKNQRTALDHAVFTAQVELKLVSRVLNVSKLTTDHLVWCYDKLEKINFSSRKLEIKPSMLLFPC